MKVPFLPHAPHHLLSLVFLITALLTSVRWYLIMVSICISLMIRGVEHLFMCLLAILVYMANRMGKKSLQTMYGIRD